MAVHIRLEHKGVIPLLRLERFTVKWIDYLDEQARLYLHGVHIGYITNNVEMAGIRLNKSGSVSGYLNLDRTDPVIYPVRVVRYMRGDGWVDNNDVPRKTLPKGVISHHHRLVYLPY